MVQTQRLSRGPAAPRARARTGVALGRAATLGFLLPALLVFGVFVLYPMLTAFSYSLFDWRSTARGEFAGVANFVALLTREPYATEIPRAFLHNVLIFAGTLIGQNTLGLALASALHRTKRGRRLFQTLYAMPYLVSPIVIGYLWTLLLSPTFGPVNRALEAIGLGGLAQPWLGNPDTALWVVVLVAIWQWMGFPVLLYGAALGGVPEELNEASALDGANAWQRFSRITLPLLTPAITTVSVLSFIAAMEAFALPYAIGGSTGSPVGSTDVLSLVFYRTAFESGDSNGIGLSSALATCLFLFIFGVAMLTTRLMRKREDALT